MVTWQHPCGEQKGMQNPNGLVLHVGDIPVGVVFFNVWVVFPFRKPPRFAG